MFNKHRSSVIESLCQAVEAKNLLTHPFYQKHWLKGNLRLSHHIRLYAEQYYFVVTDIARLATEMAALSPPDHPLREEFQRHMSEEIAHVDLWLKFCTRVGTDPTALAKVQPFRKTKNLLETLRTSGDRETSYLEAAAMLFVIEQKMPEIARAKGQSLQQFYGFAENDPGLEYFNVHATVDEQHRKTLRNLLAAENLPNSGLLIFHGHETAMRMWEFLTEIDDRCRPAA